MNRARSQPFMIQVMCVMRADIDVGDYVAMPVFPGQITGGAGNQFNNDAGLSRNGLNFQGVYKVVSVRHVGNSRDPNATAWITTLDMLTVPGSGTGQGV